MDASERLKEKIKDFEGLRLKAYKPVKTEKYCTIGYGHYGSDVKKGMIITKGRALELLEADLKPCVTLVNTYVESGWIRTQGQFDALVDFCFNLGATALRESTLLRYIKERKTDLMIAREFMRWVYSDGRQLAGLVDRRKWEAELYIDATIYKDDGDWKWYISKS